MRGGALQQNPVKFLTPPSKGGPPIGARDQPPPPPPSHRCIAPERATHARKKQQMNAATCRAKSSEQRHRLPRAKLS